MDISVIIPVKNGYEFLSECLDSVCNQTITPYEILVIANGYKYEEEPINIIKNIIESKSERSKEKNIITTFLHYNDQPGKSPALNFGIKHVKTKWVCLLDVDDRWLPNKIESQIPYMKEYDVIGTQCVYFGDLTGSPNIPLGEINRSVFLISNPIINSSALINITKHDVIWEDKPLEDYDLWLMLNYEGKRMYNVPMVLVEHRIHGKSAFNSNPTIQAYLPNLLNEWKHKYINKNI